MGLAIHPPIFVIEGLDVLCFRTVESAQSYLEPQDVATDDYVAYDSHGNLLILGTARREVARKLLWFSRKVMREIVTVESHQPPVNKASDLAEALRKYLAQFGKDANWLTTANLPELVKVVAETSHEL